MTSPEPAGSRPAGDPGDHGRRDRSPDGRSPPGLARVRGHGRRPGSGGSARRAPRLPPGHLVGLEQRPAPQLWPVIEAHMTIALAEDQRARPNPERSRRIHAALVDSIVARDLDRVEVALQAHTVATAEELIALCHQQSHPDDNRQGYELVRILVIGTGLVGGAAASALSERGHDVIGASRSSSPAVDATDPESIAALFAAVGTVDAVVAAVGIRAVRAACRARPRRLPEGPAAPRPWPRSTSSSSAPRTSATAARSL